MAQAAALVPDLGRAGDTTLAQACEAMLRQVVWANALFQQHQRLAWRDVARTFPGAGGEWIGEAALALADLAVQEITLGFTLEERRPGLLARARRLLRRVFGLADPPAARVFRFARPGAKAPIQVRLHVTHGPEGRYRVRTEVEPAWAAPMLDAG